MEWYWVVGLAGLAGLVGALVRQQMIARARFVEHCASGPAFAGFISAIVVACLTITILAIVSGVSLPTFVVVGLFAFFAIWAGAALFGAFHGEWAVLAMAVIPLIIIMGVSLSERVPHLDNERAALAANLDEQLFDLDCAGQGSQVVLLGREEDGSFHIQAMRYRLAQHEGRNGVGELTISGRPVVTRGYLRANGYLLGDSLVANGKWQSRQLNSSTFASGEQHSLGLNTEYPGEEATSCGTPIVF